MDKVFHTIPPGKGECPVCHGTGKGGRLSKEEKDKWFNKDRIYDECKNCGGQTMAGRALGFVNLDTKGNPCTHKYTALPGKWKCTTENICEHCGDLYIIDSSD